MHLITDTLRIRKLPVKAMMAFLAVSAASAQAPVTAGLPANFDAYNHTAAPVYGFEIEADGIQPSDVTRAFPSNFPVAPGQPCVIHYCQAVAGSPNGEFNTFINCGSSCSAKFQQGANVVRTATPGRGGRFHRVERRLLGPRAHVHSDDHGRYEGAGEFQIRSD